MTLIKLVPIVYVLLYPGSIATITYQCELELGFFLQNIYLVELFEHSHLQRYSFTTYLLWDVVLPLWSQQWNKGIIRNIFQSKGRWKKAQTHWHWLLGRLELDNPHSKYSIYTLLWYFDMLDLLIMPFIELWIMRVMQVFFTNKKVTAS